MNGVVLGVGRMGKRHVQALRDVGVDVVGVADPREESRASAMKALELAGSLVHADPEDLLRRARPECVVVASTAATFLLLSGWTHGPGQPKPPRVAARAAPATTAAPKPAQKKTVKPKARTRKRARPVPLTTRQISKQLFQGQCGFCHTLAAAGTSGRVGPNLDRLRPTRQRVLDAIAAGGRRTGLMPPGLFTGRDALNVATFVAEATRR